MNNLGKLLIISAFTFSGITFAANMSIKELKDAVNQLTKQAVSVKEGEREEFITNMRKIADGIKEINQSAPPPTSSTLSENAISLRGHANVLADLWLLVSENKAPPAGHLSDAVRTRIKNLFQVSSENSGLRKRMKDDLLKKVYFISARDDIKKQLFIVIELLNALHNDMDGRLNKLGLK